jgi:fatty-acyl-CoA synthase
MPGHELKVCNDKGDRLGDREIGHIMIRGASVMNGYYCNEDATKVVLTEDGWLCTGDMGYLLDGEIIITGRAKELILHNGRNIWPQDIEWAVERVKTLRNGDAAAFSVEHESDETVVVLVQCRLADALKREALRREVGAVVQRHTGVECDVVLVPPRSLPFTSSGKLSRIGAKVRFLSGEISDLSPGANFPDLRVVSGGKTGHA